MKREIVDFHSSECIPIVQEPILCNPPRAGLEIHDALTQMLLLNCEFVASHTYSLLTGVVSESIAPTLVAFDGPTNGYNALLLPLAHDNELVRNTILAASATHLQFKRPQLANIAMKFRTTAIETLSSHTKTKSNAGSNLEATLAAIVVLIINDTMQGGVDFLILLEMAKSWTEAIGKDESRNMPLRSFLEQQIHM
jgi:hypothetical protein